MNIYHIKTSAKKPSAQPLEPQEPQEYQLEKNGLLYDENGDDVFSIKELLKFNVPTFKSAEQANEFLTQLEQTQGKKLGRVPEKNLLETIRYKDTRKEKDEASQKEYIERNKKLMQGQFGDIKDPKADLNFLEKEAVRKVPITRELFMQAYKILMALGSPDSKVAETVGKIIGAFGNIPNRIPRGADGNFDAAWLQQQANSIQLSHS